MNEVIETHSRYRVRLEIMEDSTDCNPRTNQGCNLTNVITPSQRSYIDVDKDGGPLQYGWDHFSTLEGGEEMFIRWARIFHDATVIEDRPHDGAWSFWYVMPDKAAESTWTPEKIIEAEIAEYQAWASGDVYAYVIERSVTWVPKAGQVFADDEEIPEELITWEFVDACSGLIGHEYAEEAAREAFDEYKEK